MILGDEADPRQDQERLLVGRPAEYLDAPAGGLADPDRQFQERCLAGPVGPTHAATRPAGIATEQSRSAHVDP